MQPVFPRNNETNKFSERELDDGCELRAGKQTAFWLKNLTFKPI
jgi:hypothetical protein